MAAPARGLRFRFGPFRTRESLGLDFVQNLDHGMLRSWSISLSIQTSDVLDGMLFEPKTRIRWLEVHGLDAGWFSGRARLVSRAAHERFPGSWRYEFTGTGAPQFHRN